MTENREPRARKETEQKKNPFSSTLFGNREESGALETAVSQRLKHYYTYA